MHLRPRPWARPELDASPIFIANPWDYKNNWRQYFSHPDRPFYLELGCGKGAFMAGQCTAHPANNYLAIDMIDSMLGIARRKIVAAAGTDHPENVFLTAWDIERIMDILGPDDKVDGLFINFCNPWPKRKKHKKRLTYTRQLERYKTFLVPGAFLRFKTDDDHLFADSLDYLKEAGFHIDQIERDLIKNPVPDDVVTEHEMMFADQGIPIKFVRAHLA